MTTIACDGKSIACDGQAESHDMIITSTRVKIIRLDDGTIAGCAGNTVHRHRFFAWLRGDGPPPEPKEGTFAALVLRPGGALEYYCDEMMALPAEAPMAIGSGALLAVGAMEAGATAGQAVKIAIKRDPNSGGSISIEEGAAI